MEYIADDEVQSFFMKVAKEKSGGSNPFKNFLIFIKEITKRI